MTDLERFLAAAKAARIAQEAMTAHRLVAADHLDSDQARAALLGLDADGETIAEARRYIQFDLLVRKGRGKIHTIGWERHHTRCGIRLAGMTVVAVLTDEFAETTPDECKKCPDGDY